MRGKGLILITAALFLAGATWASPPQYGYEGKWGSYGTGNRQFKSPEDVAVAYEGNSRIQYFTPSGSYLGKWGSYGTGNGRFNGTYAVAVASSGNVYVADNNNHRVQYFKLTNVAVVPASLGRVKALFR